MQKPKTLRLQCPICVSSSNTMFIGAKPCEDDYGNDECFIDIVCSRCGWYHSYVIGNDEKDRCNIRIFTSTNTPKSVNNIKV